MLSCYEHIKNMFYVANYDDVCIAMRRHSHILPPSRQHFNADRFNSLHVIAYTVHNLKVAVV